MAYQSPASLHENKNRSQLIKQKAALEEQHAPLKKKVDHLVMIKHQINETQRIESRKRNRVHKLPRDIKPEQHGR